MDGLMYLFLSLLVSQGFLPAVDEYEVADRRLSSISSVALSCEPEFTKFEFDSVQATFIDHEN
jgi:hypothetical protein